VTAYVVYTARSVAINFARHRGVQNKYMFYGEKEDVSQGVFGYEDDSPDKVIIHKEEVEMLSDSILRLPERYKNLLYCKYILEMSNDEIAENLSIAPDSVRQYLTRARREVRKLMKSEEQESAEKRIGFK
jgi:RNA polymerase sigma-70 factor (ECF subfamily)